MEEKSLKEKYSEKYFNGINIKHLKCFKEKTPKGNEIEGVICKKPNRFLGSMVIDKIVNEEGECISTEQFIHAMPKIHYYSERNQMYEDSSGIIYPCYEKLDGSCLILYGLYDGNGEIIEVVPKTRGVPVADKHILDLYNEIDHCNIDSFFESNKKFNPTLLFELYGTLNLHSIFYPETRISMALIGLSFDGDLLDNHVKKFFAEQYDFNLPKIIFKLRFQGGFWNIMISPGIYMYYLTKNMTEAQLEGLKVEYPTQFDAINTIKGYLDIINENYSEVHKQSLTEGVCVNTFNSTGDKFVYLKIKPSLIEEKARNVEGIKREFIIKEVYKYFDEYGSRAKDLYKEDEDHAYNYIMNNLSEEFSKDLLENKKTKNRVRKLFLDTLEQKQPPKGLQDICNEIFEKYPGQKEQDYMRLFAQEYPEKKRYSGMAFSIFESLVRRE